MNARGVLFALIVLSSVCLSFGFSDPVPGAYPKDTAGLASEAAMEEERTLSGRDAEMSRVEEIAERAREARERKAAGGDALASTSLLDTTDGVKAAAGNPDAMGEGDSAEGEDPTTLSVNPDDYAKDKEAAKAPAADAETASAPATTLLSVGAAKGAFSAGAWNKIWKLRKDAKAAAHNPAPAAANATNPEDVLPERPPIVPRADPAFPHTPLDGVQAAKLAENLRPAKPPKTSDLIPLLRYYSPELKDTVTTLDPRELHGDSRYIFQGAVCFMYASAAVPGEEVVPVYRYLDSKGKEGLVHYLSLSLAPRSPSDTAEGVAGFLYKDPQTGLVPLSEYFDPKDRDYLYSIASAKHIVKNGNQYIFQGVLGYVHTIRTPKDGNTYGGRLGGVLDHVPPAPTEVTGAGSGHIDSAGVWHPPAAGTGSGAAKTGDVVDKRLPCKFDQTPEKDNCKPAEGAAGFTAASSSASAEASASGSAAASGDAAAAAPAAAAPAAASASASGSAAAAAAAEAPKSPSALGAALHGALASAPASAIAAAAAHTATDHAAGGFPAAGAGATGAVNAGQNAKLQLDLALGSITVPESHKEALAAAQTNTAPVNPEPPKPEHEAYNPWAAARASGTPGTLPNVPTVIHPPIVNIDDLASKNLVPHPMDPDLVPMYRYWNPKMQDHYYTLDFANLGNGRDGWQYQGIQSYILKEEKDGAVPLYRYWNIRLADHYYTTDYDELKEGKDGYKYKGILGYVEKERKEGTVPLYEYFNADAGDHFYTDNFDFLKHGASGWKYVRVACYVWPHPSGAHSEQSAEETLEKDGQVELPLLVPLYRYWNIHMRDHFYTTLWKEVEVGTHGWEYQGVQALVYATQAPGTVAFHRYWNLHTLDHFYTTNFTMLEEGGKDGWVYEGIQCYVSPFRALNTIPLYGYFNENYRDHFYTTKHLGHQIHGWVLEGIQAYVWDTPLKNCSRPPTPSNVRFDGLNTGRQNVISGFGASTGAEAVPGAVNGVDPRARSPMWPQQQQQQQFINGQFVNGQTTHFNAGNGLLAGTAWPLAQPGQNPMGTFGGPLALNNNNGGYPALGIRHWGTTVYPATSPEVYPTPGSLAPSASVIGPANSFVPVDARDLGAIQGGRVNDPLQGAPASGVGPTFVPVVAPMPGSSDLAQAGVTQPSPISVPNSRVRPAANVFDATSFLSTAEGVTAEAHAETRAKAHAKAHAEARAQEPVRLPEDGRVTTGLNTAAPFLPPVDPRSVPAARTSLLEPSMRPPVITSIRTNPATMPDLAVKNPWHPTDTFLRPRSSTGKFKPKLVVPNKHELVPLYRYWNGLRKDHFYTTKTFSMRNWEFQGLVGYLYKNHKKGTVPLFRYFNRKAYDHFYTTKYRKEGDGDYKYQGIVGFVSVKSKVGMVPLYQYYNALFADHFYTGSWKHLGQGKAGWQYEGTQGYIFPPLRVHKALPFNAGSPDSWMGGETPVPLYAYYDAKETDHFYSTSGAFAETYDKFGKPASAAKKNVKKVAVRGKQVTSKYRLLGIAGLIFLRQAPNTVPLHRYYNARANDHFYTTNWMTLQRGGKGGWKYEGIQGYVFAKHARGTVPLYRYYSKKNVDHMYTTKFEGMINKQGYKLQGIACYVRAFSGKMKNLPSWLAGVRRQPLYRYFNRKTNDHFYTTRVSLLGKDTTGRNGWIYQGISAYLPVDAQPRVTTPLYVYFNTFSNDHFYTRNFALLKRGGKFGWKFQGVEGLVYQTHQQGTVPFHRYYNTKVKDHYYTTDWSVLGSAGRNGWQYQGIEGYVFPPRSV